MKNREKELISEEERRDQGLPEIKDIKDNPFGEFYHKLPPGMGINFRGLEFPKIQEEKELNKEFIEKIKFIWGDNIHKLKKIQTQKEGTRRMFFKADGLTFLGVKALDFYLKLKTRPSTLNTWESLIDLSKQDYGRSEFLNKEGMEIFAMIAKVRQLIAEIREQDEDQQEIAMKEFKEFLKEEGKEALINRKFGRKFLKLKMGRRVRCLAGSLPKVSVDFCYSQGELNELTMIWEEYLGRLAEGYDKIRRDKFQERMLRFLQESSKEITENDDSQKQELKAEIWREQDDFAIIESYYRFAEKKGVFEKACPKKLFKTIKEIIDLLANIGGMYDKYL